MRLSVVGVLSVVLSVPAVYGAVLAPRAVHPVKPNRTMLFHSHNDYVRKSPVYEAFQHGVFSFESDLYFDDKSESLYVAETVLEFKGDKKFENFIIPRVLNVLEGKNGTLHSGSADKFVQAAKGHSTTHPDWYKYYAEGFGGMRPLQLLIELKSKNSEAACPHVLKALEPFRKRGWLTRYEHGVVHFGPLIAVGTGGTPTDQVAPREKRDIFFDCPLGSLNGTLDNSYHYNATLCPMSSTEFIGVSDGYYGVLPANKKQRAAFKKDINQAHGIQSTTRFYSQIDFPPDSKYNGYNMLVEEGSDWLNLDDMNDAAKYR